MSFRLMNLGSGLIVQAMLIALSSALQGSFSMRGSASIFVLGSTVVVLLCRVIFLPAEGRAFFVSGAITSCLWYPMLFVLVSSGMSGYPRLTLGGVVHALFESLSYAEVRTPVLSLIASIICGLLAGLGINKVRRHKLRDSS